MAVFETWNPPPLSGVDPDLLQYLPPRSGRILAPSAYYYGLPGPMSIVAGSQMAGYPTRGNVQRKRIYDIPEGLPLQAAWNNRLLKVVRPIIEAHHKNNVDSSGRGACSTHLYKIGSSASTAPAVVWIGCDNVKSEILAAELVRDIRGVFATFGFPDVHVEVYLSTMQYQAKPLLHPRIRPERPPAVQLREILEPLTTSLGMEFALQMPAEEGNVGTLGVFFEDTSQPQKLFATASRHVIAHHPNVSLPPPPSGTPFDGSLSQPLDGSHRYPVLLPGHHRWESVAQDAEKYKALRGPKAETITGRLTIRLRSLRDNMTPDRSRRQYVEDRETAESRCVGRVYAFPAIEEHADSCPDVAAIELDPAAFAGLPLNVLDGTAFDRQSYMQATMAQAVLDNPDAPNLLGPQPEVASRSLFDANGMIRLSGHMRPEEHLSKRLVFLRGAMERDKQPGFRHAISAGIGSTVRAIDYQFHGNVWYTAEGWPIRVFIPEEDEKHDDQFGWRFSASGDSGGVVFDGTGRFGGVIVGGAGPLSVAIPMYEVLNQLKSMGMSPRIVETPSF